MMIDVAAVIKASIDGGSTEGEDSIDGGGVSKRDYYRIEGGDALPVAEGSDRQLVGACS